jgi:hypothetical protein
MTTDEVLYRRFREGDEVRLNRAFNEVFRLDRPLAEWGWKFPPVDGGRTIMLALREDELLAHYAGLPCRLQVDGREWPAATIVDVFSTRAARRSFSRRGVWVRTVEEFFAAFGEGGRFALLFGFPGRRALRLGVLQLGYDALEPQPITYLCRPVRRRRTRPVRLLYRAELARDWEPHLDVLWTRVRASYPVAVVRDADRALTRLAGHPTVRYHRFMVYPRLSAEPVAFAAFRSDGGRCRWADLLWDHEHPGALALLARIGANLARQTGAEVEELWLSGDPAGSGELVRHGFAVEPEPNGLVVVARSFAPELDVTGLDGRFYVTMADADLV